MKKFLLIVLVVVVIGGGAYYLYVEFFNKRQVDLVELIPETAFAVYENNELAKSWNGFLETTFWNNLSNVNKYRKVNMDLQLLDSLSGKSGNLDLLLSNHSFFVSCHVTSKSSYDFIYYLDLSVIENAELALQIIKSFESSPRITVSSRNLQGITINEIKDTENNRIFSYIIHKNHFAGTFTPFLVEDVVRNINSNYNSNFVNSNNVLFTLPKSVNDDGNILLHQDRFVDFLNTFCKNTSNPVSHLMEGLLEGSNMDFTIDQDNLVLNGFSVTAEGDYLNVFNGQYPQNFDLRKFIPNRTAVAYHIGLSNPMAWYTSLNNYRVDPEKEDYPDSLQKYIDRYEFNIDRMTEWMGNEIVLSVLESIDPSSPNKLLLIESKDITETLNQMNQLTDRINNARGDTLYYENFGESVIRQLPITEFPLMIFGEPYKGFEQCFYTAVDNTIIIANNIQSIKILLTDIENEDVWIKSVEQEEFLQTTLGESNVSIYANTARAWNLIKDIANEDFAASLDEYAENYRRFDKLAIQFSNVDDRYFTSLTFSHKSFIPNVRRRDFDYVYKNQFNDRIVTRPFIVRNHNTNNLEVLVQDVRNDLYLISADGEILWSDSLDGEINTEVHQLDYYKNGNLQYIFGTRKKIYVIDRLGRSLEDFPKSVEYEIDQLSLIDYDNSKRYRIMIADKYGNLYLYNKEGANLEGWAPRIISGRLVEPPFHIRVRGRDCLVAMEANGIVNVMSRRSRMYDGFPLKLNSTLSNPLFVNIGSSFERTHLTTVTDIGEVVTFDLNGSVINQSQLYRPNRDSKFLMAVDGLGKTFVVARKDYNRLTFTTRHGQPIFEKDYISEGDLELQYYNFGSGNEIFVVADRSQNVTYIYNSKGQLINSRPLTSGFPIGLLYYGAQSKYRVYYAGPYEQGIAEFYQ